MRISFDRVADRYDETRAYPAGAVERIVEALEETLSKEGRFLDIGVGTGRLAVPMRRSGFDVTGVDISRRMLERARVGGVDGVLMADARTLPFPDRSFDYSVSVHLTHLIEDWRRALAEIGRVTSDKYATVATEREGCQVEEMQRAYEDFCAESGHIVRHPGIRENDLATDIRPLKRVCVVERVDSVETEETISRYRERVYSDLWDVPEDVHRDAVKRLEGLYGDRKSLDRRQKISLIVWDAESVRDYASPD